MSNTATPSNDDGLHRRILESFSRQGLLRAVGWLRRRVVVE